MAHEVDARIFPGEEPVNYQFSSDDRFNVIPHSDLRKMVKLNTNGSTFKAMLKEWFPIGHGLKFVTEGRNVIGIIDRYETDNPLIGSPTITIVVGGNKIGNKIHLSDPIYIDHTIVDWKDVGVWAVSENPAPYKQSFTKFSERSSIKKVLPKEFKLYEITSKDIDTLKSLKLNLASDQNKWMQLADKIFPRGHAIMVRSIFNPHVNRVLSPEDEPSIANGVVAKVSPGILIIKNMTDCYLPSIMKISENWDDRSYDESLFTQRSFRWIAFLFDKNEVHYEYIATFKRDTEQKIEGILKNENTSLYDIFDPMIVDEDQKESLNQWSVSNTSIELEDVHAWALLKTMHRSRKVRNNPLMKLPTDIFDRLGHYVSGPEIGTLLKKQQQHHPESSRRVKKGRESHAKAYKTQGRKRNTKSKKLNTKKR